MHHSLDELIAQLPHPQTPAFIFNPEALRDCATVLQQQCHGVAFKSGWWNTTNPMLSKENPLHFSNKLALIHSEISESMEGDRKNLMDDHLPHYPMRAVELADAAIRIFDLAGGYGIDLASIIVEKLIYNQQRKDHKPENREAVGGKTY